MSFLLRVSMLAAVVALAACTPAEIDPPTDNKSKDKNEEELTGPALLGHRNCDPIVPTQCGFPFPSNVYLVDDATMPGKKRVAFGDAMLPASKKIRAGRMSKAPFETRDGFSQSGFILTHLPGATTAGLPNENTLASSVEADSPTVLVDAETGRFIPHIAELDMHTDDDDDRAFIIRAFERLDDETRYIVAIRNVKDSKGAALAPSPVFKALRDDEDSEDPTVEPRRALYEDIFAKLQSAGVEKANLQLAWDFTTASKENTTGWLVHMRDDALAAIDYEKAGDYTISAVETDPNTHIEKRIKGTFKVPLYLTQPGITKAGEKYVAGRLVFGEDGKPKQNGWANYDFLVQVPKSVAADPGQPILQQGHGLLGSRREGQNSYFARLADEKKYVTIAVDLVGMAEDDEDPIMDWINGDMSEFQASVDRQHQGHINQLLAMRMMMSEQFRAEEALQFGGKSAIDPTRRYYRGDSQGGIMGLVYMALSKDVERGYLGEPGMSYSLLLTRSVDFTDFLVVLQPTYREARNVQYALGLVQMMWDRTEPNGWAPYVTKNTVTADTPEKRLLMGAALGDYQVTPLGAHIMARAVDAVHLTPGFRSIYGLEDWDTSDGADGPLLEGSAYQEFDFGLPAVPITNVPPTGEGFPEDKDPHDEVRKLESVFNATDEFLRDGVIRNHCSGKCDYSGN